MTFCLHVCHLTTAKSVEIPRAYLNFVIMGDKYVTRDSTYYGTYHER